jgi:hypothetical protein
MTILATIGSTARQIVSLVRSASKVGWTVRAHTQHGNCHIPADLVLLSDVELVDGDLTQSDRALILTSLFSGAKYAFVNTAYWKHEVAVGKACADAAKSAGVQHYLYSNMPIILHLILTGKLCPFGSQSSSSRTTSASLKSQPHLCTWGSTTTTSHLCHVRYSKWSCTVTGTSYGNLQAGH